MKKFLASRFGLGLMVCLPVAILAFIANFAINLIVSIRVDVVDNDIANFFITSGMIMVVIFGAGFLLSINWLANLVHKMMGPLTKSSAVQMVTAIFNRKSFERMKNEGLPEVIFESAPNTWKSGVVTSEWMAKDDNGDDLEMCVIFELTTPLPISGCHYFKKKSDVRYTGRTIKHNGVNATGCWVNFSGFDKPITLPETDWPK